MDTNFICPQFVLCQFHGILAIQPKDVAGDIFYTHNLQMVLDGSFELETAKKRLAVARRQKKMILCLVGEANHIAETVLGMTKKCEELLDKLNKEVEEARAVLKRVEDRWDVITIDDTDEEDSTDLVKCDPGYSTPNYQARKQSEERRGKMGVGEEFSSSSLPFLKRKTDVGGKS